MRTINLRHRLKVAHILKIVHDKFWDRSVDSIRTAWLHFLYVIFFIETEGEFEGLLWWSESTCNEKIKCEDFLFRFLISKGYYVKLKPCTDLAWNHQLPPEKSLRILSSPFRFFIFSNLNFEFKYIFFKYSIFPKNFLFPLIFSYFLRRVLFPPPQFQISFKNTIPPYLSERCISNFAHLNFYLNYFISYKFSFKFGIWNIFSKIIFYIFFLFQHTISDYQSISVWKSHLKFCSSQFSPPIFFL